MDLEQILRLVLLGILHLVLAVMLLQDLATRKNVLGGAEMALGGGNNVYYFTGLTIVPAVSSQDFLR